MAGDRELEELSKVADECDERAETLGRDKLAGKWCESIARRIREAVNDLRVGCDACQDGL